MAPARCPVCNDIISIGVSVKLYQGITCPTCLTSVRVVSLNPLELELPDRSGNGVDRTHHSGYKKNPLEGKQHLASKNYGGFDELDENYEEFDDYVLERRLRYKSERERQRKSAQK